MPVSLHAFLAGFPDYLLFLGTAVVLLVLSGLVYVLISPIKEISLIREGNTAAALVLATVVIGLSLPVSAALANSLSISDLAIWSIFALLVQLLVLRLVDILLPGLTRRLESGDMAAALILSGIKLSAALITAAGLVEPNL